MKLKKSKTLKLFYKKYPFKIVVKCVESWRIKQMHNPISFKSNWIFKNLQLVKEGLEKLSGYDSTIRTGYHTLTIYCKEREAVDQAISIFGNLIVEIEEPHRLEDLSLLNNLSDRQLLCDNFPFNRYKYKVFLKAKTNKPLALSFSNWADKVNGQVKMPNQTYCWMKGQRIYNWNPYFYVEDAKTLSVVRIFLTENISRVNEFVLRDSINTV